MKRTYNRLQDLTRFSFLEAKRDGIGQGTVWALTRSGYAAIRHRIPHLRSDGWQSENPLHDLLVSVVQLGDWLKEIPAHVDYFTEQELRHFDFELYPEWVPKTELHRPDGYWRIRDGNGFLTVALEVELHQKSRTEYAQVARFYDFQPSIDRVLWVVRGDAMAKMIQRTALDSITNPSPHNFVQLSDFCRSGWQASITFGPEANHTIQYLLRESPGTRPGVLPASSQLDTRKYPATFPVYQIASAYSDFN